MAHHFIRNKRANPDLPANTFGMQKSSKPPSFSADIDDSASANLRKKVKVLEDDIKRRQESYVQRARVDKDQIDNLSHKLREATAGNRALIDGDTRMKVVKEMHQQILKNVENVQSTTSRILQEQERDLLRAFRARLFGVQNELEKEKNKSEEGASLWIEKNRQLEKDLEWAKEMADRLERVNQKLTTDNTTLKQQFKAQEDDREFLIKELVAVRKDNERLRQEACQFKTENEELNRKIAKDFLPSNVAHAPCTIKPEKIQNPASVPNGVKYKNIINRMKSLLERERKNLRRARAAYEREVQDRSELEYFLRRCVNDVRNEISRRRGELVEYSRTQLRSDDHNLTNAHSIDSNPQKDEESTKEFSCADRERVMELLLSQERVISLLYSKTFPIKESIPVANSTGQAATRFPSVQTN
jgi:hypothetical protein